MSKTSMGSNEEEPLTPEEEKKQAAQLSQQRFKDCQAEFDKCAIAVEYHQKQVKSFAPIEQKVASMDVDYLDKDLKERFDALLQDVTEWKNKVEYIDLVLDCQKQMKDIHHIEQNAASIDVDELDKDFKERVDALSQDVIECKQRFESCMKKEMKFKEMNHFFRFFGILTFYKKRLSYDIQDSKARLRDAEDRFEAHLQVTGTRLLRDAEDRLEAHRKAEDRLKTDLRDAETRLRDAENRLKSTERAILKFIPKFTCRGIEDVDLEKIYENLCLSSHEFEKFKKNYSTIIVEGTNQEVLTFSEIQDEKSYIASKTTLSNDDTKKRMALLEKENRNTIASTETAITVRVREALQHSPFDHLHNVIIEKSSHNISFQDSSKMEVDGLLVYDNAFVFIECKKTIVKQIGLDGVDVDVDVDDNKSVMLKALKNAKRLQTEMPKKNLGCLKKPFIVVLAYSLFKGSEEEKQAFYDLAEKMNVVPMEPNGNDYGFVLQGTVQSFVPPTSQTDFSKDMKTIFNVNGFQDVVV